MRNDLDTEHVLTKVTTWRPSDRVKFSVCFIVTRNCVIECRKWGQQSKVALIFCKHLLQVQLVSYSKDKNKLAPILAKWHSLCWKHTENRFSRGKDNLQRHRVYFHLPLFSWGGLWPPSSPFCSFRRHLSTRQSPVSLLWHSFTLPLQKKILLQTTFLTLYVAKQGRLRLCHK